jgi:hypothetical protein
MKIGAQENVEAGLASNNSGMLQGLRHIIS